MDFDVNMQLEGVDFYSVAMLRENSFLLFVSCSASDFSSPLTALLALKSTTYQRSDLRQQLQHRQHELLNLRKGKGITPPTMIKRPMLELGCIIPIKCCHRKHTEVVDTSTPLSLRHLPFAASKNQKTGRDTFDAECHDSGDKGANQTEKNTS
ncbi:hypothetical protein Bca101_012979 [Brassica carinata]